MGWNTETGTGINRGWGTVDGYWNWRKDWIADWSGTFEEPLNNSISIATDVSKWVSQGQINSHLVQVGDMDLQYLQYEYGGDWP
jgi:hypothetical protein